VWKLQARVVWAGLKFAPEGAVIILWTANLASFALFSSSLTVGAFGVASVAVAYKLADERLGCFRSWLQVCERALGFESSPHSTQGGGQT
jgi:hypothetical protein